MSFVTSSKFFAIGDLHGDLGVLIQVLNSIDLIDDSGNWVGGKSIVVIVGDFIYEAIGKQTLHHSYKQRLVDFIDTVSKQALLYGGMVLTLIGNHEYMRLVAKNPIRLPKDCYALVKVNNVVMTHGGMNEFLFSEFSDIAPLANSIDDMIFWANKTLRKFISGEVLTSEDSRFFDLFYMNLRTSILWDRTFSKHTTDIVCPKSSIINIDDLIFVFGHTIQSVGPEFPSNKPYQTGWILANVFEHKKTYEFTLPAIQFPSTKSDHFVPLLTNFICNGNVWRIDTGMSRARDSYRIDEVAARFPQVLSFSSNMVPSVFVSKKPVQKSWISTSNQVKLLEIFIQNIQNRLSIQIKGK